jgi:putative ABC transport system ATP-binding protein
MSALIQIQNLSKTYSVDEREVRALDGVNLEIPRGEFLAIIGRSGCGKSTLLNLLGGLDVASGGSLRVDEQELST